MNLDFYFNEWAFLARTDPALFEQRRREMIDAFLGQTGVHRRRLEVLQTKIDQRREQAATPECAVAAISELMCDSLSELSFQMADLVSGLKHLKASQLVQALAREQERQRAQKLAA